MKFNTLHVAVTYLLAGLGFFALSLGHALPPLSAVVIFAGFLGTAVAPAAWMRRSLWARAWTAIVVVALGIQIVRGSMGEPLLTLGVEYAALLQLSRLAYRRSAREYQQIAIMAFLHLIAATVLESGIVYGAIFFGFVIVLPWMLALTHLRAEIERHYQGAEAGPSVERVLASRRVAGPSFLLGTASLSVPLFAITAIFFLAFPRVGMGFLSLGRGVGRQVAGFGRNVQLGGFGRIRDDPTVVLRVEVPNLGDSPPRHMDLRMRGTSFDHYEDGGWTRSRGASVSLRGRGGYFSLSPLPEYAAERELRVILDPLDEPVVFLPEGTIGLSVPPRMVQGLAVQRDLLLGEGVDLRYADPDGLEFTYTAHVSSRASSAPAEPMDSTAFARYLELPPGQDRIAELARSWTAGAETSAAKADALLHHLRDSGEYRYTLEQPDTRGQDPLEVFLLSARAGHCEYFSTALAVMLRSVGVPARNVTGFLGGTYNRFGRYYAVRQGDAHSWVEAWIDGSWVTLDATPPAREAAGPPEGALGGIRALFDALSMRWSRSVVGYDLRQQSAALARLLRYLRPGGASAERVADTGREGSAASTRTGGGASIGWLLLVLVAVGFVVWVWRRFARGSRLRTPPAVRLYRSLERRLSRRGHARPPGLTPERHALALRESGYAGADAVDAVTRCYMRARYAGARATPTELKELRRRLREL